ncbi:GNAT family N-acetyltransferase [Hydrogenophaga sp. BPS33]|uniref:GNAT family N-acetyltransferase n=1 Tax=Hydrogenophaga sp. BPS33 TaxID=2651974 RepID=UPI00131F48BA|nr:GNAT family N-acetyltransferase [Hydrogenophaga sp. BPS33]QHE88364.1 N-acetyltransferase [Hydrogenophaga sp. BPS33]
MTTHTIQHQETAARGVFHIQHEGRQVGEMTYSRTNPSLVVVDHTYVDPGLRGHGLAQQLQDAMVAWARKTNTKVVPVCSYVKLQFERNAAIRDVLA